MIFNKAPRVHTITDEEFERAIMERPTPADEYFGANVADAFNFSTPGAAYHEIMLPDDDIARPDPNAPRDILEGKRKAPVTRDDYLALQEKTSEHIMSHEEWRESSFYREAIPFDDRMTQARAQYKAEQYDAQQYRNWLRQNREWGVGQMALALAGSVVGSAPDPINYLPIFGPAFKAAATARSANILKYAALGAAENTALTALSYPVLVQSRDQFGDDVTLAEAMLDIAVGAAFGGVLGGVQGARGRLEGYRPDRAQQALTAIQTAADDLASGRGIDLGTGFRASLLRSVAIPEPTRPTSLTDLGWLYPLRQDVEEITPETLVDTKARELNPKLFTRRDDLLVRQESYRKFVDELTKDNPEIVAIDAQIRDTEARIQSAENNRKLKIYTDRLQALQVSKQEAITRLQATSPDLKQVRTALADVDNELRDISPYISAVIKEAKNQLGWTGKTKRDATVPQEPTVLPEAVNDPLDQFSDIFKRDIKLTNASPDKVVHVAPEVKQAADNSTTVRLTKVDDIAKEMEIDLASGNFPEMETIQYLEKTEALTARAKAELAEADEILKQTDLYAKAIKDLAFCELRGK